MGESGSPSPLELGARLEDCRELDVLELRPRPTGGCPDVVAARRRLLGGVEGLRIR